MLYMCYLRQMWAFWNSNVPSDQRFTIGTSNLEWFRLELNWFFVSFTFKDDKNLRIGSAGPSPQGSRTPSQSDAIQGSCQTPGDSRSFASMSPGLNFSPASAQQQQQQQQSNALHVSSGNLKMGNFMDMSPTDKEVSKLSGGCAFRKFSSFFLH